MNNESLIFNFINNFNLDTNPNTTSNSNINNTNSPNPSFNNSSTASNFYQQSNSLYSPPFSNLTLNSPSVNNTTESSKWVKKIKINCDTTDFKVESHWDFLKNLFLYKINSLQGMREKNDIYFFIKIRSAYYEVIYNLV